MNIPPRIATGVTPKQQWQGGRLMVWCVHSNCHATPQSCRIYITRAGEAPSVLWLGHRLNDRGSTPTELGILFFAATSRPAPGPIQPPMQWVLGATSPGANWPGHEADHSSPTNADDKNGWNYTSATLYVFMLCLIRQKETLPLPLCDIQKANYILEIQISLLRPVRISALQADMNTLFNRLIIYIHTYIHTYIQVHSHLCFFDLFFLIYSVSYS